MHLPSWVLGIAVAIALALVASAAIYASHGDNSKGWDKTSFSLSTGGNKTDLELILPTSLPEEYACERKTHKHYAAHPFCCVRPGPGYHQSCFSEDIFYGLIKLYEKENADSRSKAQEVIEPDLPTSFPESMVIMEKLDRANSLLEEILSVLKTK